MSDFCYSCCLFLSIEKYVTVFLCFSSWIEIVNTLRSHLVGLALGGCAYHHIDHQRYDVPHNPSVEDLANGLVTTYDYRSFYDEKLRAYCRSGGVRLCYFPGDDSTDHDDTIGFLRTWGRPLFVMSDGLTCTAGRQAKGEGYETLFWDFVSGDKQPVPADLHGQEFFNRQLARYHVACPQEPIHEPLLLIASGD